MKAFKNLFQPLFLSFVVVLVLGLSAPTATMAAQSGKLTVLASSFSTTGLDPLTVRSNHGLVYVQMMFDRLISKDKYGKFHPELAKSWEIDQDWGYIKFDLNKEATFSNDTPVTAEDCKFSLERQMAKDSTYIWKAEFNRHIDRIEAVDAHTLMVYLKSPYPGFLQRISLSGSVVPKKYYEKMGPEGFRDNPIGAGPFKFVDYKHGLYVKAVARKNHYRQVPSIKEVEIKHVKDADTRFAMMLAGEADLARISVPQTKVAEKNPNLKVLWTLSTNGGNLVFADLSHPDWKSPFHDLRVRRAVGHAINYDAFPKILGGGVSKNFNITAEYHPGYDPEMKAPYAYNPEKAKALLKEAGYADGFDTEISTYNMRVVETEAIKNMLSKVGIRAKLNVLEVGTFVKDWFNLNYKGLVLYGHPFFYGRMHPATALQSTLDVNSKFAGGPPKEFWADREKLDAVTPALILHDEYGKLSSMTKDAEIATQVRKITKIYNDTAYHIQLFHNNSPFVINSRVKNWQPLPGLTDSLGIFYEYITLID